MAINNFQLAITEININTILSLEFDFLIPFATFV